MVNKPKQQTESWKISFQTKETEIFDDFLESLAGVTSYTKPDDNWAVEIYLEEKPNPQAIHNLLKEIAIIYDFQVEEMEAIDWVSAVQDQYKPLSIGRFFIASNNYKNDCPEDKDLIIIEASRAFGTGEHNTTSGCIEALETLHHNDFQSILDMGTGTAILAIAAAKLWQNATSEAYDIDPDAVAIAQHNIIENKVSIYSDVSDGYQKIQSKFDLVICNILAKPLINMSEDLAETLNPGGYTILSGFLKKQLDEVVQAHEKYGMTCEHIIEKERWMTVIMKQSL